MTSAQPLRRPSVVIVGGGMGGIQAAKTLATAEVDITLVNPHNYYLFQPLIYEVANALLQAEDVAHSIRGMLRYLPAFRFRVAAASSVDWERRELRLDDGDRIGFDYLILATGLQTDFRGIPGAAEHTLPLKSLDDAVTIRTQMLRRLETVATHPALVPAGALDVVIVGGGTTGVETAGAFAEIYHHALPEEFAELDFSHAGITLLEAGDAILPAFHPRMQRAAHRMLTRRGVQVRLRAPVARAGPASVTLTDGAQIPAGMIVWATGVRATHLADSLALPRTPDGRILVQPNLSLPGHPQAFAIGDMAALPRPAGGLHPALAQFAIQGGRHAAREIMRHIKGTPPEPFRYWDKGMTASVGRDAGIVQTGHIRFGGRLAFFAWGVLHSLYVPGWRNRLSIDLTWLWSYVTHRRAALMLIGEPPRAQEQLPSRQPPPESEPGQDLTMPTTATPPAAPGSGPPTRALSGSWACNRADVCPPRQDGQGTRRIAAGVRGAVGGHEEQAMNRTTKTAGIVGVALVGYDTLVRRRILNWGATGDEQRMQLPGDEIASGVPAQYTKAVTIEAPPEAVWPWLAQIGDRRAGFYSYDWVERFVFLGTVHYIEGTHSATRIHPGLQQLHLGDRINTGTVGKIAVGNPVTVIEPGRALVIGTWAFILRPLSGDRTRLLVRNRDWGYLRPAAPPQLALLRAALSVIDYLIGDPLHFAMERKMMLGLKQRAESAAS